MTTNKFQFDKVGKRFRALTRVIPIKVANNARNFFNHTFVEQGFEGKHWKEVQRRIPGTKAWKYPKTKQLSRRTSPIGVRTGKMRREVNNSIRETTWQQIRLGISDATPYAEYFNNGTDKMEARPIMKDSVTLRNQTKEIIRKELKSMF